MVGFPEPARRFEHLDRVVRWQIEDARLAAEGLRRCQTCDGTRHAGIGAGCQTCHNTGEIVTQIDRDVWDKRFAQRLADVSGHPLSVGMEAAKAADDAYAEGVDMSPEDAADDEKSY